MKNQPKPAQVFHFDLYGKREEKYDFLNNESLDSIPWTELDCPEPYHFFVPKDFSQGLSYETGFSIDHLFIISNSGIQTKRDKTVYCFAKSEIENVICDFKTLEIEHIRKKYKLTEDGEGWSIAWAKNDILRHIGFYTNVLYHPFDVRKTYYTGYSKGFMARPRSPAMNHALNSNLLLLSIRNSRRGNVNNYFITNMIVDKDGVSPFDNCTFFPLFKYSKTTGQQTIDQTLERTPNLNLQIVQQIAENLGLSFTPEKDEIPGTFAPIDLLDYIYAVLHSPTYREKYKEFLKIDFPRVPYPKDAATFWQLVALGGELRQIHLLESPVVNKFITQYPVGGSNVVEKVKFENGNVYINETQHFANVPELAWKFYIGGYQPAQKWLKDRKDRELQFDDIKYYQKIIVALSETDRLMKEIDEIGIE